MQYQITHSTLYRFSQPVFLEPHVLRLVPRSDVSQRLHAFDLQITPSPEGSADTLDAEGNVVSLCWWEGSQRELKIECRAEVETCRQNAFNFLLQPDATRLPLQYDAHLQLVLASARRRPELRPNAPTDAVEALVAPILRATHNHTMRFLSELNLHLFQTIRFIHRDEGPPRLPHETLSERTGACRDLAVLFIDACRCVGFAARFVSGYHEGDPEKEDRELHAWAEVYIPGGGWRGFDPTLGLAVADRHVAVATSVDPRYAAPVSGTFRGDGATSQMSYSVAIANRPGD